MNYLNLIKKLPKNAMRLLLQEPGWILPNILVTYACTQRCLQCSIPAKASPNMIMTQERLDIITDRLIKHGTQGVSVSGGDPLSHAQLVPLLEQISRKGFSFIHLLTNLYSNTDKINELLAFVVRNKIHLTTSFDGFDEVADQIRGAKDVSQKVTESILKLHQLNTSARHKIQTRATIVISQLNLHQVERIIEFFEEINWEISVDIYRFSSIQHLDSDELHIKDLDKLSDVIERCKSSKHVVTPRFLLNGYVKYLKGDFPKKCPYLDSPTLGSKFFIQPNGDVLVCKGSSIGNLIEQSPQEIIQSTVWQQKLLEFEECKGCWNPCYTTFSGTTAIAEMSSKLWRVAQKRK